MPWSSASPRHLALYGLAGSLALAELVIFGLAMAPDVDPAYRAYYIDRTTTCLERPATADYAPATTVSFLPDGAAEAKEIRVCGWEGPAGDGTHSIGTSSRLRVRPPPHERGLAMRLEMVANLAPGQAHQRVRMSVNGIPAGQVTLTDTAPRLVSFMVPAEAAGAEILDILLEYPDAYRPHPRVIETRNRAIKLLSFALEPAREPLTVELDGQPPSAGRAPGENPAIENEEVDRRDEDAGEQDRYRGRPS